MSKFQASEKSDQLFYIVNFEKEGTVAVVPDLWMVNLYTCAWPDVHGDKAQTWVNKRKPMDISWPHFTVRIMGSANNLLAAREKLEKSTYTSDINSEVEVNDESRNSRKKHKPSRFQDTETDSADDEEIVISKQSNFPIPPATLGNSIPVSASPDFASPRSQSFISPRSEEFIQTPRSSWSESLNIASMIKMESEKNKVFQKKVFCHLEEIKIHLKGLTSAVSKFDMSKAIGYNQPIEKFPFTLPMEVQTSLEEIDRYLSEDSNMKNMVSYLARTGGNSKENIVRRILAKVMTNWVASHLSFTGRKGKIAFGKQVLSQAVYKAVILHNQSSDCSEKEYSEFAGNWFRSAPLRHGGLKKIHLEMANNDENDDEL